MINVQEKSDIVKALVFHLQVSVESQVVHFSVESSFESSKQWLELNQVQDIMNWVHIIDLYLSNRLQRKVTATTKNGHQIVNSWENDHIENW